MALLSGFFEFLSDKTTGSPLTLATGGSTTIQETYEIENLSPEDAQVLISTDGGSSWFALPPRQKISVLTKVTAAPTIKIAAVGPIYRVPSPVLVNGTPTTFEYAHRIRVAPMHSAKVA